MARRHWLKYLVAAVTAAALLWFGVPEIPPRWNPWAPIRLADPPNLLTGFKLQRLQDAPQLCQALLDGTGFTYRPVADQVTGPGCGFANAVRVSGSGIAYGNGFVATCPLVVGLALFERHVLQPAAAASFGQGVVALDHLGTYACRNVGNRSAGRRSQHATANAIDIGGVRLADGTRISVAQGWQGGGTDAAFLRELHEGACGIFTVVLGPDYNAAHHDHLHLDLGGFGLCR
jgi:hypothetical protein